MLLNNTFKQLIIQTGHKITRLHREIWWVLLLEPLTHDTKIYVPPGGSTSFKTSDRISPLMGPTRSSYNQDTMNYFKIFLCMGLLGG